MASFTVLSLILRTYPSVIFTTKRPSAGSRMSQSGARKKSRSRSRMSLTRAGSTPSTANDVESMRCADAKTMPLRVAWSRAVCTASSMVAFRASSVTTWSTRWIPPFRSRPSLILPG